MLPHNHELQKLHFFFKKKKGVSLILNIDLLPLCDRNKFRACHHIVYSLSRNLQFLFFPVIPSWINLLLEPQSMEKKTIKSIPATVLSRRPLRLVLPYLYAYSANQDPKLEKNEDKEGSRWLPASWARLSCGAKGALMMMLIWLRPRKTPFTYSDSFYYIHYSDIFSLLNGLMPVASKRQFAAPDSIRRGKAAVAKTFLKPRVFTFWGGAPLFF